MPAVAKRLLRLFAAVFSIAVIGVLYISFGDLSRHQGRIEDLLSELIGHEVRIDGELRIDVGRTSTFTVGDARISNAHWEDDGRVLNVGHFSIVVDTWSLYQPPLLIKQLAIDDIELRLATNADGSGNWETPGVSDNDSSAELTPLVVEIGDIRLRNAGFSYDGQSLGITGEVAGVLRLALGEVPTVSVELRSPEIVLSVAGSGDKEDVEENKPLFSSELIDHELLRSLNAVLNVEIEELSYDESHLQDFSLTGSLQDGRLAVSTLSFRTLGGAVSAGLSLTPADAAITADAHLDVNKLRVGSVWSEDAGIDTLPALSGAVQIAGSGNSLQQIMAASNGRVAFRQGRGRLRELTGAGLFGDIVVQTLQALNPLNSEKPYTSLECAFYTTSIVDGEATIDDLRVQTDSMMFVGDGKLLFTDESVDMTVRAKPREGLGLSLGGVANSFVKLGGSLSQPELQLDAAGTATTTGAAMATGGLSLVARGLWDRLSAANDICETTDNVSLKVTE